MSPGPEVLPISPDSSGEVAALLRRGLNPDIPLDTWRRVLDWAPFPQRPSSGFWLRSEGRAVGAYAAVWARREAAGDARWFCNLHSWYVVPEHRGSSLGLVRALLASRDAEIYNPTPNEVALEIFRPLRFRSCDPRVALLPALPWPHAGRVFDDHNGLAVRVGAAGAEIARHHSGFPWVRSVAVGRGDSWGLALAVEGRWKGVTTLDVHHVGDPAAFRRGWRALGGWAWRRHGARVLRVERRLIGPRPRSPHAVGAPRLYLPRGPVGEADFSNAYTDLVALPRPRSV